MDSASHLSYEGYGAREEQLLKRPDNEDLKDKLRLTQTHLEQINANKTLETYMTFLILRRIFI